MAGFNIFNIFDNLQYYWKILQRAYSTLYAVLCKSCKCMQCCVKAANIKQLNASNAMYAMYPKYVNTSNIKQYVLTHAL